MLARSVRWSWTVAMSLAIVAVASAESRLVSVDLKIDLVRNDRTVIESLVMGWGKVLRQEGKTVWVRVNDPADLKSRLAKVRARTSVESVEAIAPLMPADNILALPRTTLNRLYAEYRESYIAWAKATDAELKIGESGETKVPGTGFLQSYLQYRHDRSYPNEFIDFSGYEAIAERRTRDFERNPNGRAARDEKSLDLGFFGTVTPTSSGAKSSASSPQWEFTGPRDLRAPYRIYFGLSPVNGRANAVAFDPFDANTFYAGGAQGGVWKTSDGGDTWSSTTDGWPLLGVSSLAVSPANGDIVLAGTGDFFGNDVVGIGVMRSVDGGQTWTRTGLNMGSARISAIKFLPESPNVVLATAGKGGTRGIFRSTNAGESWTQVVTTGSDWADLEIGALRGDGSRTLWASSGGNPGIVAFSDNGGATWFAATTPVTGSQNPLQIAVSRTDPETVYLMSTTARKIYKSTNKGGSWTDISAGFQNGSNNYNWSQGWYDYYLDATTRNTASGPVDVLFAGLIDIVMSIDGGTTWRNIGGTNYSAAYSGSAIVHQDNHNIAIDPNNPLRALVATDGGVFVMNYNNSNDTVSWSNLNKNLGITQFYTLAVHPTNPDYIKGGTQDNSTPHSFADLNRWGNPGAGDGAGCGINPLNPNIQYNSSQFHGLSRTTNGYSTESGFKPNFGSDSVPFIGDLWIDPNNPVNVYVNTNYLWRYREGTGTWDARLGGQLLSSSGQVRAMGFANGTSNIFYTGASNGDLYMTRDFGASWTRLDNAIGFTNRSILDISVSPSDTDNILVAVGGSGDHLYRVTETNSASPVLTSVSGSGSGALPNVAISSIARDPWRPETSWYVATDVGVFWTQNSGASWVDITQSRGLPNVEVRRLVANKTTGFLTAATYGRGMWRLDISPPKVASVVSSAPMVVSGDSGMITVSLDRPARFGGETVQIGKNSLKLNIGSTLFIPEGSTEGVIPFTTVEANLTESVNVTADLGQVVQTTIVLGGTTDSVLSRFRLGNAVNVVGSLTSLTNSDDNRMSWTIRRPTSGPTTLTGYARVSRSLSNIVRIEVEGLVSTGGLECKVFAFDRAGGFYQQVGSGTLGASDTVLKVDISNFANYIDNSDEMQLAIEVLPVSGSFSVGIDRIRIRSVRL